ncbi:zinc-dependent alcohol dehydrogenase [Paramicrobacterium chengjingii]|uniref:Alcohol dehydrogenase catalytic domain-containing protein n=1 Tax=Paramicrobacterium chengjingii TaxID=2769067 RepID=A0ABX6YH90_9MICO|nr:alcohol dehydrogenase catalytic domain-containing protein [Microbacterium chengjingii]QPZ38121.1 alcohol dehydrogenase catalytic domain-containing protein [Microbacterium chengjingii]
MKAALIRAERDRKILVTEDVPRPEISPSQVLVRIHVAGICGSDLHGFMDAAGTARRDGLIMSHEAAGIVEEIGSAVESVTVGDRVTVDPQVVCGQCEPCRNGWISICDNKRVTGSSLRGFEQGSMAEYLAVESSQVYNLPENLTYAMGALIEPLSNAIHVINRASIRLGDTVVVLGAGTLGLCMIQAARAAGAGRIVASDTSDFRLTVARQLGADVTVNPLTAKLRDVVSAETDGVGADVVIESVGIDATYQDTIHIVRKRGRIMFFGAVQPTVSVDLMPILHKEIDIVGCTGANDETQIAIDMMASGAIDIAPLLTHSFSLDEAQAAFDAMADPSIDTIKVQVTV